MGKNTYTIHELWTSGQNTLLIFLLNNLLSKLYTYAKLIPKLISR